MRNLLALGAALVAAGALAACGGGGGGSTPSIPVTQPTTAPQQQSRVVLSWSGAAHSHGTSVAADLRRALDTVTGEPIELGELNNVSVSNSTAYGTVLVQEVDASGSPQPLPSGSPQIAIANASLAAVQPTTGPSPASTGAPVQVASVTSNTAPGQTTVTVQLPASGASPAPSPASMNVNVYAAISVQTDVSDTRPARAQGWTLQSDGSFVAASPATADFYVSVDSDGTARYHFPYGYQVYPWTTAIGSITNALSFTSSGTAIAASALENTSTYGDLVVGTAIGEHVKLFNGGVTCSGDAVACNAGSALAALALGSKGQVFAF